MLDGKVIADVVVICFWKVKGLHYPKIRKHDTSKVHTPLT